MIAPLPLHISLVQAARMPSMLSQEDETMLVTQAQNGEPKAIERLILCHLRMAVSGARRYAPNADPNDLVQEGVLGLMRAIETFDVTVGVRFSTYARSWMKERQIQHTQTVRSNVALGHSHNRRRAMYHLGSMMAKEDRDARKAGENVTKYQILERAAAKLKIPVADAEVVLARSGGDFSLNMTVSSSDDGFSEWVDTLVSEAPSGEAYEDERRSEAGIDTLVRQALDSLNARERRIILDRHLTDTPVTLEVLGTRLGVSKERIRQIESKAMLKMAEALGSRKEDALSIMGDDG